MIAIGALYVWTGTTSAEGRNLHLLLAEGFQKGQTNLPIDPRNELLALEDPYDPAQNIGLTINDASLYDGKWYLYFGPVPAVLVFLPLHVAVLDLTDNWAAPLFGAAAFACAAGLLLLLIARFIPRTPTAWRLVAVAGLGLGNLVLFILRRPEVYETAILAGQFFLFSGALLLFIGTLREKPSLALIALGSVSLGLATGSRANLALAAPLLVWSWWRALGPRAGWTRRSVTRTAAAAAVPFVLCVIGLAVYNVVRFGSPTEFGLSYQTGGYNPREVDFFSPGRLLPAAWFYLLQPPSFGWNFPFITLAPDYPGGALPSDYGVELVAGVLPVIPILAALVAAPWIVRRSRGPQSRDVLIFCGILVVVALGLLLLPVLTLPGATERLLVDTSSLLLITALLAWLWLADRARASRPRRGLILGIGTAALVYGAVANLALGVVGYNDALRHTRPQTYHRLESAFSWVPLIGAKLRGEPILLKVSSAGSVGEFQLAAPGPGAVDIEGDFYRNPQLPRRAVVDLVVTGSDGVVRRQRLLRRRTVIRAGLEGSGLQTVGVRFEVVRVGDRPPRLGDPGPGLGLGPDAEVVRWARR